VFNSLWQQLPLKPRSRKKYQVFCLVLLTIIEIVPIIVIILQVNTLLATLELKESAGRKGQFAEFCSV
jgi:hypothetical protein